MVYSKRLAWYPSNMGRLEQCCSDCGPRNRVDWRENFKGSAKTAPILIIVFDFYVFRHVWAQSAFGLSSL